MYPWLYHRLRNLWPIWYYVVNRRSRKLQHAYMKNHRLDNIGEKVLQELNQNGIATIHISEFFPTYPSLFEELEAYTYRLLNFPEVRRQITAREEGKVAAKDDIIVHLLGGYSGRMSECKIDDPFIRFTLHPRIIELAASYLGVFPKFRMFSVHSTVLVPSGSKAMFSQRWHRDPEDKKMLKVFLYLNDVEEDGVGPFAYVRGSHLGGKWRHIFPQLPPLGRYPKRGAVENIIPPQDIKACKGQRGTIVFCDTSGLHQGGYSTTKRRLMYAATFVTEASVYMLNYWVDKKVDLSSLSPMARFALEPSPHMRRR
jgi:hypothetical protein